MQRFIRHSNHTTKLILTCVLLCESYSAYSQANTQANPNSSNADENPACSNATAEDELVRRETALLGAKHAKDHANARIRQCRVAKGLETVRTASPTLLAAAEKQSPNTTGRWSAPINVPVKGIASVLLNNGNILFWSYNPADYMSPTRSNTGVAYLWNSANQNGRSVPAPENLWCAGQTILGDGRVYAAGGNLRYPDPSAPAGQTGWMGALSHYTFNPDNSTWTRQLPDMSVGRWYPTTTQLADNRVVVTSGRDETGSDAITNVVEVFTPSADKNGNGTISVVSQHDPIGYYPFQFLLPSGQMLQAGPDRANTALLTPNLWGWSTIPNLQADHYDQGNSASYTDTSVNPISQTVLVAGGVHNGAATSNIQMLDGVDPSRGWKPFPSWLAVRHNGNMVILPDGTLFVVGGNADTTSYDNALFESELYNKPMNDPSGNWVAAAPHTIQAAYHSSALLLPDATVLLSQDDEDKLGSRHQVQIYSPPYLFKGKRPQITTIPASSSRAQTVAISTDADDIVTVMLVAPSAVTHGNDMHQRAIKLAFQKNGRNLVGTIPASASLVPPGYYMVFVLNSNGVPSTAKFIRIS